MNGFRESPNVKIWFVVGPVPPFHRSGTWFHQGNQTPLSVTVQLGQLGSCDTEKKHQSHSDLAFFFFLNLSSQHSFVFSFFWIDICSPAYHTRFLGRLSTAQHGYVFWSSMFFLPTDFFWWPRSCDQSWTIRMIRVRVLLDGWLMWLHPWHDWVLGTAAFVLCLLVDLILPSLFLASDKAR